MAKEATYNRQRGQQQTSDPGIKESQDRIKQQREARKATRAVQTTDPGIKESQERIKAQRAAKVPPITVADAPDAPQPKRAKRSKKS
jgi:hypothetical protein